MSAWRQLKKLAENLALLAGYAIAVLGLQRLVRFFCEDETRLGLKTMSGRKITAQGIQPKGKGQGQCKATYLYGIRRTSHGSTLLLRVHASQQRLFPGVARFSE